MESYESDFLKFIIDQKILGFGSYTLKSGRISPYFYNSGQFNTGAKLMKLGRFYAEAIMHSGCSAQVLFGPAYKGIPLVCAASIALSHYFMTDIPYAFNRKEEKDHGEGGNIVGSALQGKVMIIDDVISAGLTIGESIELVRNAGAEPEAVCIAFDRQEKGVDSERSAVQDVEERYGVRVISISRVTSLLRYLADKEEYSRELREIDNYRTLYGVAAIP